MNLEAPGEVGREGSGWSPPLPATKSESRSALSDSL